VGERRSGVVLASEQVWELVWVTRTHPSAISSSVVCAPSPFSLFWNVGPGSCYFFFFFFSHYYLHGATWCS